MKEALFVSLSLLLYIGCTNESSDEVGSTTPLSQPFAVYNQAYQENFVSDSITDIVVKAKNAYVLVDTFDSGIIEYINILQSQGNQIGGYISTGTGERDRDDFSALEPYLASTAWSEWSDEFFVSDVDGVLPIMKRRIDKMAAAGVDWVEFDNMDWLDEQTKTQYHLTSTVEQAKAYINTLCDYTHNKGMKCMAKNTVDGFTQFDGVLYESYNNEKDWWDEAGTYRFLDAGKPVIINHYYEAHCDAVYTEYKQSYSNDKIAFICEDNVLKKYRHFNQK